MPKVDRGPLMQECSSKAFEKLGLKDKVYFVGTMVAMMLGLVLPTVILAKLGISKPKNGHLVSVIDGFVYQVSYENRKANATVVQGKDGSVLVYNAPQASPQTKAELEAMGPVKYIVLQVAEPLSSRTPCTSRTRMPLQRSSSHAPVCSALNSIKTWSLRLSQSIVP